MSEVHYWFPYSNFTYLGKWLVKFTSIFLSELLLTLANRTGITFNPYYPILCNSYVKIVYFYSNTSSMQDTFLSLFWRTSHSIAIWFVACNTKKTNNCYSCSTTPHICITPTWGENFIIIILWWNVLEKWVPRFWTREFIKMLFHFLRH